MNKILKFEDIKDKCTTDLLKEIKIKDFTFELINYIIYEEIVKKCIILNEKGIPEINFVHIEMIKRYYIIYHLTDIEINKDFDIKFSIELSNWSIKIWDKLINKIKSYQLFEQILNKAIKEEMNKLTKLEYKIIENLEDLINFIKNINIDDLKKNLKDINPSLISQITKLLPQSTNNKD